MKNLGNIMKQVQDMQTRMSERMQEKLADTEMTGGAGAGMVQATLNGRSELKRVKIDPSLLKPEDAGARRGSHRRRRRRRARRSSSVTRRTK